GDLVDHDVGKAEAEQRDRGEHGEGVGGDLEGVEAGGGGDIDIGIVMVHGVDAPQGWRLVEGEMGEVVGEVEGDQGDQPADHNGEFNPAEQAEVGAAAGLDD